MKRNLLAIGTIAMASLFANPVFAQSFGGSGIGDAICQFIESPILAAIFAVILIGLILAWVNDLVKGVALEIVKVLVGVFAILEINFFLGLIGLPSIC